MKNAASIWIHKKAYHKKCLAEVAFAFATNDGCGRAMSAAGVPKYYLENAWRHGFQIAIYLNGFTMVELALEKFTHFEYWETDSIKVKKLTIYPLTSNPCRQHGLQRKRLMGNLELWL
jgi:hypothetical protein